MISLFFVATATKAQNKIQVTSFNRMETDVTARITAPQRDQNGSMRTNPHRYNRKRPNVRTGCTWNRFP